MAGKTAESMVERHTHRCVEVLVLKPHEIYHSDTVEQLGHAIRRAIDSSEGASAFILDLTQVEYLSSAALGLIINIRSHLADRGYRFALVGAQGEVAQVLECTRLSDVMTVFPTVKEALAEMGDPCKQA